MRAQVSFIWDWDYEPAQDSESAPKENQGYSAVCTPMFCWVSVVLYTACTRVFCPVSVILSTTANQNEVCPRLEKRASLVQYSYRKRGTHARVCGKLWEDWEIRRLLAMMEFHRKSISLHLSDCWPWCQYSVPVVYLLVSYTEYPYVRTDHTATEMQIKRSSRC